MSKSEFSPTAEGHIRNVLSMKEEQLATAINIILGIKSKTGISPIIITDALVESGYDNIKSEALSALIYNLTLMQNSGTIGMFYEYIKQKFPNDFKRMNDLVKAFGPVMDEVSKFERIDNISTFGLPHLSDIDLMTDYRIVNINDKKEFVPVVICKLLIHEHITEGEKAVNKAITFQFSPEELDSIISEFQSLKDKIQEEQKFVSISEG